MKKIFTFLFAALMSVGMYATTVTWNSSTLSSIYLHDGESFTQDDVTVTVLDGRIDRTGKWTGNSPDASFKFSTSLGNFTKIEITGGIRGLEGSGWTQTDPGAVWTGDANETTFGMYFRDVTQIVFTIGDPAPATYTLQLVADPAMGSVAVTNLLGSNIIDNGNGNYTVPVNAKVTILATPLEGYEFSGWLEGNVLCDFIDCGTALNTLDNPLTFTMSNDAACKAEFKAVAPATPKAYSSGTVAMKDLIVGDTLMAGVTLTDDANKTVFFVENRYAMNGSTQSLGGLFNQFISMLASPLLGDNALFSLPGMTITPINEEGNAGNAWVVVEGDTGLADVFLAGIGTQSGSSPTAVENVQTNQVQATKFFRDGMLFIEKNGKIYNVMGAEVK